MKYIKVTNYVSNVNRLSLEKLGMSTKRDNDQTIGQFGSGIKFAPIAAIRKGMRWAFTGEDSKGNYVLEYIIKDDEGIPSVFYKYQDYEKPSSFSADAGVLSWKDEFQIYREVVSNAIDEDTLNGNGWNIEIVDVDEFVPVSGEFSVYITATDELLEIHKNFDKYFCVNRKPIYSDSWFKLYEPIDDSFRVYCKGILVFTSEKSVNNYGGENLPGMFDYDISNLDLNEDRTVDGNFSMNYKILTSLSSVKDREVISTILQYFFENEGDRLYEKESITDYTYQNINTKNSLWEEVFDSEYLNSVMIMEHFATINALKTIEAKGFLSLKVDHEGVYSFMRRLGISCVDDIFGESLKYNYHFNIENYPMVVQALDMVISVLPEVIEIKDKVGFYTPFDEEDMVLAMTVDINEDGDKKKIVLINEETVFKTSIEKMIGTIVHEWDHYSTGISDGDMVGRMFRDVADDKIAKLICKIYKLTNK